MRSVLLIVLVAFLASAQTALVDRGGVAIVQASGTTHLFLVRQGSLLAAQTQKAGEAFPAAVFRSVNTFMDTASAICGSGSKLLIADATKKSVIELDPVSMTVTTRFLIPQVRSTTSLAASSSNVVAVLDSVSGNVLLRTPGVADNAVSVFQAEQISSIAFSGDTLVGLRNGDLYRFDKSVPSIRGPWSKITNQLNATEVSGANGIIYALTASGVSVVTYPDGHILPIESFEQTSQPRHLAASDGKFAIYDSPRQARLIDQPRLPISITIEGERYLDLIKGLLPVYDYLLNQGSRLERRVALQEYPRLVDWLAEQFVIPPITSKTKLDDTPSLDLARWVCAKNPSFCPPALPVTQETLRRPIAKGESLQLPIIPSRAGSVFRTRRIVGTIGEYLDEMFTEGRAYSNQLIARLNEQNLGTLDNAFYQGGWLFVSAANIAITAGSIVEFGENTETRIGDIASCGLTPDLMTNEPPVILPAIATSVAGLTAIPYDIAASLPRGQVQRVDVQYIEPYVETLDVQKDAERMVDCFSKPKTQAPQKGKNPERALITQVLKARGARFRIIGADGKPMRLSSGGNLLRDPLVSVSKDGTFELKRVFVAGYKPSVPQGQAYWVSPPDITQFKTKSPQNIRNLGGRDFVVPSPTWHLAALVSISEIRSGGALSKLIEQHKKNCDSDRKPCALNVFVSSQERLSAAAQASNEPTLSSAQQNRREVLDRINYGDDPRKDKYGSVTLGLVEAAGSVKAGHPGFFSADGKTTTWVILRDGAFEPLSAKRLDSANNPLGIRNTPLVRDNEHGTHVAGILASRDTNLPGLMPSANLFLIDTASSLDDALEAIVSKVRIVNFSQEVPVVEGDKVMETVKKKIQTVWRDKLLFVAAAGNSEKKPEGADLNFVGGDLALIKWTIDSPDNIIGVAATDLEGRIIKTCDPDPAAPAQKKGCSNYGKRYVQLAAPGYHVLSLGLNPTGEIPDYVSGSGTSMATPLVAATAAMIQARASNLTPRQLKARLIYTADFDRQFVTESSVWGGRLNVQRALLGVENGDSTVIVTSGSNSAIYLVKPDYSKWNLKLRKAGTILSNKRNDSTRTPPTINTEKLLRVSAAVAGDGTFWLSYVESADPYSMRIAYDAIPDPNEDIPFTSIEKWDGKKFVPVSPDDEKKFPGGKIPWSSVQELIAPIPADAYLSFE